MQWTFASHARGRARGPADPGRFELTELGAKPRLAWPRGACAIPKAAHVAYWADHAVVVERTTLTVVHADREELVRLELDELALAPIRLELGDGELAIESLTGVMTIPLRWLERLAPGQVTFRVETTYPLRDATARVPGRVVWLMAEDALISMRRSQLRLDHRQYGLEKGMDLAFCDELWPGTFAFLDVPGRPRQTLIERLAPYTATGRVTQVRPRDPATGQRTALAWSSRRDELDRLLVQLAQQPEDDTTRGVIIDLLGDAGEPCAEVFALLRAGAKVSVPRQRAALGSLDRFMTVKYERGLPWAATLTRKPPEDRESVAALLGDVRIGMVHALWPGKGPPALYEQLVASPALIGLRRANGSTLAFLQALRAGGHALTHLDDVRLTRPAVAAELAHPAFSTVRYLTVTAGTREIEALLDVVHDDHHGVFAHAPRELSLVRRDGASVVALARVVFARFPSLPCAISIAGFTLERVSGGNGARFRARIAADTEPELRTVLGDLLRELGPEGMVVEAAPHA